LEEVHLNDKINKVLEDLELIIHEKEAKVYIGQMPVIQANRRQMQQLFQNLISNALKYHKPGESPVLYIESQKIKGSESGFSLPEHRGGQYFYLIQIRDNGIGFEQKDAERIFNVFTRLHGNTEYKGTGVGLSIVRKVVENHNGFIQAESAPEKGATFKILLPA
jgi:signal transduction histidine kinase